MIMIMRKFNNEFKNEDASSHQPLLCQGSICLWHIFLWIKFFNLKMVTTEDYSFGLMLTEIASANHSSEMHLVKLACGQRDTETQ